MTNDVKIFHSEDLVNQQLLEGSLVNFIHSNSMTLAEWKFEPNTLLPEHSHPHEQITKIISGEFELTIENKKFRLKSGSVAVIPPHAVHSAKSITACHIMDVFHPVREDFR